MSKIFRTDFHSPLNDLDFGVIKKFCSEDSVFFDDNELIIDISRFLRAKRNFALLAQFYEKLLINNEIFFYGVKVSVEYSYFLEMIKNYNSVFFVLKNLILERKFKISERVIERFLISAKQSKSSILFKDFEGLIPAISHDYRLVVNFVSCLTEEELPSFEYFLDKINFCAESEHIYLYFSILSKFYFERLKDATSKFANLSSNINFSNKVIRNFYYQNDFLLKKIPVDNVNWDGLILNVSHSFDDGVILIGNQFLIPISSGVFDSEKMARIFNFDFLDFEIFNSVKLFHGDEYYELSKYIYTVKPLSFFLENGLSKITFDSYGINTYIFNNVFINKKGVILVDNYIVKETCYGGWGNGSIGFKFSHDKKFALSIDVETIDSIHFDELVNFLTVNRENYYHFTIDFFMKYLLTPHLNGKNILSEGSTLNWHKEIFDFFKMDVNNQVVISGDAFVKRLHLPLATTKAISYFREQCSKKINGNYLVFGEQDFRYVYIDRRKAKNRKLINEDELIEKLASEGFYCFDPEGVPVSRQIHIFSTAHVIVSASGAGLTNMIYCSDSCKVVELFPEGGDSNFWPNYAQSFGLELFRVNMRCEYPSSSNLNSLFKIDVDGVIDLVRGLQHECYEK